jgi:hypothetical protein
MIEEDFHYFSSRAEQELILARASQHPNAAWAHAELANLYLEKVEGREARGVFLLRSS